MQRPPKLIYPRLPSAIPDAPHALGLIGTANQAVILVRASDSQASVPIAIGGTINRWTLIAVEGGNQAVWEDPSGTRHTLPIGEGVDANAFDPTTLLAFSSNGEGNVTVVKEDSADKFSVAETVTTAKGARTMALDPETHKVYVVTAKFGPPPAPTATSSPRRRIIASTNRPRYDGIWLVPQPILLKP